MKSDHPTLQQVLWNHLVVNAEDTTSSQASSAQAHQSNSRQSYPASRKRMQEQGLTQVLDAMEMRRKEECRVYFLQWQNSNIISCMLWEGCSAI